MKKISLMAIFLLFVVTGIVAAQGRVYYPSAGSSLQSVVTGGTGTTCAGCAVGDVVVVTSVTPTSFGVISKPSGSNYIFGINDSGVIGFYQSLNIMLSTSNTTTGLSGFLYSGGSGSSLTSDPLTNLKKDAIDFANLVSTGNTTLDVYVPWAGTITSSNIFCQATSTISAAIYTAPTNTDVFTLISSSAPVDLSNAAYEAPDTTLTGWTTSFSAGTYFRAVFNGMTGGPCSIGLGVTKTN